MSVLVIIILLGNISKIVWYFWRHCRKITFFCLIIASKIIERKKELGIDISGLPSGAQNIDLQMEKIRVEEIVNALLTNAKIEVAIPPGTLVQATGGNAGGPIVVVGSTLTISKGEGIIR